MKSLAYILTGLAVAVPLAVAAQAPQQHAPGAAVGGALQQELSGMRRSLDELVALVAATLDQQQMSVLMRRIELKQRGLQPLQTSLDRARRDREAMQEEHRELTGMEDMFRRNLDPDDPDSQNMRMQLQQMTQRIENLMESMESLDLRIIELEDDLADEQNDILILVDMVDERLGLR